MLEGGGHSHMTPEEHYRRMMSALNEQGEEQQQRLYQLANNMGLPSHGETSACVCVLVCVHLDTRTRVCRWMLS